MLAGLIFATEDAEDRRDVIAATLPFGGMTLLEYQARLLVAAGVGHILVAVSRVTPALLGAVSRVGRRGVAVDLVRSAQEAAAKAHPLAAIVVVADSLVTTDTAMQAIAGEAPDTLFVVPDDQPMAGVERLDAASLWSGLALLGAKRLHDIAAMPAEYDFQSGLLRAAVQAGARRAALPAGNRKAGHGVERTGQALAARSNAVLAGLAGQRRGWVDRFVINPVTRLLLPRLVERAAPGWAVEAVGLGLGAGSLVATALGYVQAGVPAMLLAVVALSSGSLLGWLRGADRAARRQEVEIGALVAALSLVAGGVTSLAQGHPTGLVLALALVGIGAVAERVPVARRAWQGGAPGYLLLLAGFSAFGLPVAGLGAAALYALAILAAAVEASRQKA